MCALNIQKMICLKGIHKRIDGLEGKISVTRANTTRGF
jgi:hypothetical protein